MIYLASPYSSSLVGDAKLQMEHQRYIKVLEFVTFIFLTKGPPVFSPIVYTHPIYQANRDSLQGDALFWRNFNTAFIRKSEAMFVLMLPGWDKSIGVANELKLAKVLNLPVEYYNEQFQGETRQ